MSWKKFLDSDSLQKYDQALGGFTNCEDFDSSASYEFILQHLWKELSGFIDGSMLLIIRWKLKSS